MIAEMTAEVEKIAIKTGWNLEGVYNASTGSVYLDFSRKQGENKEWVVIRVSGHKKVYNRWLTTYSYSPYEYNDEMLIALLSMSFGEVGDIL